MMPFDYAGWQVAVETTRPKLRPMPNVRRGLPWVRTIIAAIVVVPFFSEILFPESGLITRLTEGNQIANENLLAQNILWGADAHNLSFTVAGRLYHVSSPGRSLTATEQKALFAYAARHGFPRYSADGPFAIDP